MNGLNYVFLLGRCTKTPVITRNGEVEQVTFQLTTRRVWRDKLTQLEKASSESHQIVAFNQLVPIISVGVVVGKIVAVQGQNQYHKARNGGSICQVKANYVEVLDDLRDE